MEERVCLGVQARGCGGLSIPILDVHARWWLAQGRWWLAWGRAALTGKDAVQRYERRGMGSRWGHEVHDGCAARCVTSERQRRRGDAGEGLCGASRMRGKRQRHRRGSERRSIKGAHNGVRAVEWLRVKVTRSGQRCATHLCIAIPTRRASGAKGARSVGCIVH
jgi:hypothetical protein